MAYELFLPWLILVPVIGALALLLAVPRAKQQGAARLAFGFSLIPAVMVILLLRQFDFSAVGQISVHDHAKGAATYQVTKNTRINDGKWNFSDVKRGMWITDVAYDGQTATGITVSAQARAGVTSQIDAVSEPDWQFGFNRDWLGASFGTWFHLGMDSISLWLVVLTVFLTPLSILGSFKYIKERQKEFYAWMLMLLAGMVGVFVARDVLLFYLFFEFTLIPMFFIIGIWGGKERKRAAGKFFLFTFAGSVLTLVSIVYVASQFALAHDPTITGISFKLVDMYKIGSHLDAKTQMWVFLGLMAAFAVKVPLFPVHTWLPLAYTEAPATGTVILAGVLAKLGTYGILRFAIPMLPMATMKAAPVIAVFCIIGMIYASLISWVQGDMKKLIAYASVSHVALCVLGMFALTGEGLTGSVLYMLNHGLSTGALFLVVGMIYERYHTQDMNQIGGIVRRMPALGFFAIFFVLSSVALPGLNGFVSEFLVLVGTFVSGRTGHEGAAVVTHFGNLGPAYAIPAATGVILGAVYMLYWAGRVVFGPLKEPALEDGSHDVVKDLSAREWAILTPIAIAVVVMGVAPKFVMDSLQPAVKGVQAMVADGNPPVMEEMAMGKAPAKIEPTPVAVADRK